MHQAKTSKLERKNYVLLWGGTDAVEVDFTAFISKHPGETFELGFIECALSRQEKALVHARALLDETTQRLFDSALLTLLRQDLQPDLYTHYHVGQLID